MKNMRAVEIMKACLLAKQQYEIFQRTAIFASFWGFIDDVRRFSIKIKRFCLLHVAFALNFIANRKTIGKNQ
jgi:hypothetical protein